MHWKRQVYPINGAVPAVDDMALQMMIADYLQHFVSEQQFTMFIELYSRKIDSLIVVFDAIQFLSCSV